MDLMLLTFRVSKFSSSNSLCLCLSVWLSVCLPVSLVVLSEKQKTPVKTRKNKNKTKQNKQTNKRNKTITKRRYLIKMLSNIYARYLATHFCCVRVTNASCPLSTTEAPAEHSKHSLTDNRLADTSEKGNKKKLCGNYPVIPL